jgi:GT2 family glycosyltransferase/glycosyltransferase involved in cell wall biosynthesis
MRVSVLIPVYNARRHAQRCIKSVLAHPPTVDFEVIVVNNGSSANVTQWISEQEANCGNLHQLQFPEPLGFARAVNAGAAAATGDVLVLLNSDTAVSAGAIASLCEALASDESLGVATPVTNWSGERAQIDPRSSNLDLESALALAASQPNFKEITHIPHRVAFFCAAIRRSVWLELGGLDERYRVGNFEDDDFCLRLRLAGYRLGVVRHAFVYHYGGATFHGNRLDFDALMSENGARFAARARELAMFDGSPAGRRLRQQAPEISVVIHGRRDASLERTLRSLENQTISGFEILTPDSRSAPRRTWIAHLSEGDIVYPFHLESLVYALRQFSAESAFSDPWTRNEYPHPDATRLAQECSANGGAPIDLSGWMHHASLDPVRLWEQGAPVHWARPTWEPGAPLASSAHSASMRAKLNGLVAQALIEPARRLYRRIVPLHSRHLIDARVRKALALPAWQPAEAWISQRKQFQLREAGARLRKLMESQTDTSKLPVTSGPAPVIFFNTVAWNSIVQRPHHFARGLARRGHPVFWIETTLAPPLTWSSVRPLPEPFPGLRLVYLPGVANDIYRMEWDTDSVETMSLALAHLASVFGLRQMVMLVQYPRWEPLAIELKRRLGWNLIYDCLDDQQAFADLFQTRLANHQDRLIEQADALITSSAVLRDGVLSRREVLFLPNAADFDLFSSVCSTEHGLRFARPIIGYFGALADWLDVALIEAAAVRFPEWSFVFIGPHNFSTPQSAAGWERATARSNITRLPPMEPNDLARHLADFDVCIVPFRDIPVTRAMNAVKIYEYLAAGKPVVCRDLPEIRRMLEGEPHLVALYSTPEEFFDRISQATALGTPELADRRRDFGRRNDWSVRVDALAREIERVTAGDLRLLTMQEKPPNPEGEHAL